MATIVQKARKEKNIVRLEEQLKSGLKTVKKTTNTKTELNDSDIKRIKKEIETLKSRV
jgi:hypothetical protein